MTDLARFVAAQEGVFETALAELKAGRKRTHWMWFIFPQLAGLGRSAMAQRYAIRNLDEARAYLAHPILGPRLVAAAEAMLSNANMSANDVLGQVDALKLRSCVTLFAQVETAPPVFARLLDMFYEGAPCPQTMERLADAS